MFENESNIMFANNINMEKRGGVINYVKVHIYNFHKYLEKIELDHIVQM